jgi:RNA polymerase sigma-70 factor, ECF subfamily
MGMRVVETGTLSDGDLIGRSLANPACFAVIFDRHADEILRYAHARLGPDLAEDVVAETFLAAFARRDRYDTTRADARPWLYGIAIRQIGRHRRAGARRLRLLRSLPSEPPAEDPAGA